MKDNKEVKIAIVVGIIMLTICLIAFVTTKSQNKVNTIDVKIFKLFESVDENGETKYQYRECDINNTDIQINIYKETAKALKLSEDKIVFGKQIKGEYKVEYNGKMVAFDKEANKTIYLGETKKLYNFDSDLYETVVNVCN